MPTTGQAGELNIAGIYRTFARLEARGRSPQYEALALAVAEDQMVQEFLRSLPSGKRQPNLVFAAARYLLGAAPDIGSLRTLIADRQHELAAVRDGTTPVAFTDPHGTWLHWLLGPA